MKRIICYSIFILLAIIGQAQTISVSSFKLLDTDLTANTAGTIEMDQNGETAALIKVVTTQTGFTFDGGAMGIVKTKQTPGEVWVYIPRGSKKISIKHPQLGVLRDYFFPITIEPAKTYEMILKSGEVQTLIQQDAGGQYLVMHITPSTASVYIDEQEVILHDGFISKFMAYGKHSYRIINPLYKTEAGSFEINNKKLELDISLNPNYGILYISTNPENGAKVYIDDEITYSGITPFATNKLKEGEHKLRFQMTDYETKSIVHHIHDDGSSRPLNVELNPIYAEVTINVSDDCELFINSESKGKGKWFGRLSEGLYHLEASKKGHLPSSLNISVIKGINQVVTIPDPKPVYGSLNISSTPIGSTIYIDNEEKGETPDIIHNLLIGEHKIKVVKQGYSSISKNIVIKEGEIHNIELTLEEQTDFELPSTAICSFSIDDFGKGTGYASKNPLKKAAYLKVFINGFGNDGFAFDCGDTNILKKQDLGDIVYLYIKAGTKKITVYKDTVPVWIPICTFIFDIPIESGRDYRLTINPK